MHQPTKDRLEILSCGSIIQHGPYNDRIYLMKPGAGLPKTLPKELKVMAEQNAYSKVFIKIPSQYATAFAEAGYTEEAAIPGFYSGADAGVFMGYYLSRERAFEADAATLDEILELAKQKAESPIRPLDDRFALRACGEADVDEMAEIYRAVFPTYPFPIHDPLYLRETMQSHIQYFGVETEGHLVALSSAEMDESSSNVEMTDFATLPDWLGNGFSVHLLAMMEEAMRQKGIKTAYTIARALSPGMNITFAKLGYTYGGRLRNNTNISGQIESMNIWYKPL
ncbi:MAG: putative beta-lysine N-acetyltransferase [Planctomycetia bacterium]|jgi:putative beta-lysine N-acetyltransferase